MLAPSFFAGILLDASLVYHARKGAVHTPRQWTQKSDHRHACHYFYWGIISIFFSCLQLSRLFVVVINSFKDLVLIINECNLLVLQFGFLNYDA
jgi:hypothetical protein